MISILEARHFIAENGHSTERQTKDYEIDMELADGRRYIYNRSEPIALCRGDILVRSPRTLCQTLHGGQSTYLLTLDFSDRAHDPSYTRNLPGEAHPIEPNPLIDRLPPIIHPENTEVIARIYRRLISFSDTSCEAAKESALELLYRLNAEVCRGNYERLKEKRGICDELLSYMRANCDKKITLNELSAIVHLDKSYLSRLFRAETGKTPINALIDIRMERACDLVTSTDEPIGNISALCGYRTISFFIAEYKKRYGLTPVAHRELLASSSDAICLAHL